MEPSSRAKRLMLRERRKANMKHLKSIDNQLTQKLKQLSEQYKLKIINDLPFADEWDETDESLFREFLEDYVSKAPVNAGQTQEL